MKLVAIFCSLLLIPFYLYTAFAVFNPVVTKEYENYYIRKTTPLSVREQLDANLANEVMSKSGSDQLIGSAKRLMPLMLNADYRYDDDRHIQWQGFAPSESGLRWTNERRSALYFRLDQGADLSRPLRLSVDVLPNGRQQIIVSVNGSERLEREIRQPEKLVLEIEPGVLHPGVNVLEFQIPWARVPGNGDQRLLGFAISKLGFNSLDKSR